MKRYLYEIDRNGVHWQGAPFMPRVLAEKTAKAMRKDEQRWHGRLILKTTTSKTTITTGDATPHGYTDWWDYIDSIRRKHS